MSATQNETSGYTVPPPSYAAPKKASYGATAKDGSADPLLNPHDEESDHWASGSGAPRNDWAAQGEPGDEADDFKIGVTVSQSHIEIRMAFVRKVYAVLFCQLLATTVVGWLMLEPSVVSWTREHSGLMMIPMFGAIGVMLATYWKRHSHPLNLILLSTFTVLEAITVGSILSYFEQTVVLQALLITTLVFVSLTLFTLQSKYDFSSMGGWLYTGLWVFFLTGIVGFFLPWSRTTDMVMAGAGVLLFSLYIVYDTSVLMRRLSVEEWVIASISLYLDVINLFLQILRLLSDVNDR